MQKCVIRGLGDVMAVPDSDERLCRMAAAGDQQAVTELLSRHCTAVRGKLSNAIEPKWRGTFDVDDIMQVTYVEVILRIREFRPVGPDSFRSWLTRIAENNLRDAIRWLRAAKRPDSRERVSASTENDSMAAIIDQVGGSSTTPSRIAIGGELRQTLEAGLVKLPPDYAQAIRLFDFEGLSAAEVGASMKRSPGACHMLHARALDRLREVLPTESKFFTR